MITADFHLHSNFSSDSKAPMEDMIEKAVSLGMDTLCFTDHMDYDFPVYNGMTFLFEPEEYRKKIEEVAYRYKNKIKILFGIELGLQPYLADRYKELTKQYDFDFAIGSSHLVHGVDPYLPSYWQDRSREEGIAAYFQSIIDNVKSFQDFQIYGHLDYVVRYTPDKNYSYRYKDFMDLIDEMLKTILEAGKGIEINTAGYKYGLGFAHPQTEVLLRYKELGGELITIGSDGHKPEHLGYDFKKAEEMLLSHGFQYYAVFEKKKPIFRKLG